MCFRKVFSNIAHFVLHIEVTYAENICYCVGEKFLCRNALKFLTTAFAPKIYNAICSENLRD